MSKNDTSIQPFEKTTISRKEIIINNFIGGLAWSLGTTIGFTVIIAVIGFISHEVNVIPIIGGFLAQILDSMLKNSTHFGK